MGYKMYNFTNNDDVVVTKNNGCFQVIEYKRDLSVNKGSAMAEFYAGKMNVRRRQVLCNLQGNGVTVQKGEMQWTVGNVNATTGIKGAGDLVGKMFASKVTGEDTIKPEYTGNGLLVLEPTYKHILLLDLKNWGGGAVIDDGIFKACDDRVKSTVQARSNLGSALAGGEGFFNTRLQGDGIVVIESVCPEEELITIDLDNDVLKIDGNMAIAWSPSLSFTVERSGKTLLGSAASGEGLVNVFRGSGRVMMMPVR